MSAVIRVECAVCGPLEDSIDSTTVEKVAARHERDFGAGHEAEMVV